MERRDFLNRLFCSTAGVILLPSVYINAAHRRKVLLKAGICTDVHRDAIPDSEYRLQTFIDNMNDRGDINFIIQLGDFSRPYDYNLPFMEIWRKFKGPAYHVIGNHEIDGGFSHDQVVEYFGAIGKYYSFDACNCHFIVLNGNEKYPDNTSKGFYPNYIGETQRRWLADDLDKTKLPVVVFCHQPIDAGLRAIDNAADIRLMFERANDKAGFKKVKLIINGHRHLDVHETINGIHYVSMNSMSYYSTGVDYHERGIYSYSKEIEEKYYSVKYTIPYKEPLWAVMTVFSNGEIEIEGKRTEFMGASLAERGVDASIPIVPYISNRQIK